MTLQKLPYPAFQGFWSVEALDNGPSPLQIRSFTSDSYRAIKDRENKKEHWRRAKVKKSSDRPNRDRWKSPSAADNEGKSSPVSFEREDDISEPVIDLSLPSVRGTSESQSHAYVLDGFNTPSTEPWESRSEIRVGLLYTPEPCAAPCHNHSQVNSAHKANENTSIVTMRKTERSGCGFSTDASDSYSSRDTGTVGKRCGDGHYENNTSGSVLSCPSPRQSTVSDCKSDTSVCYTPTDDTTCGTSLSLEPNSEHFRGHKNRHQGLDAQTDRSPEQMVAVEQRKAEFNNYSKERLVRYGVRLESVHSGRFGRGDEQSTLSPTSPGSIDASSSETRLKMCEGHHSERAVDHVPDHDVGCEHEVRSANDDHMVTNCDDTEIPPSLEPPNPTSDAATPGLSSRCLSTKHTFHSNMMTASDDGTNCVTGLVRSVPHPPVAKFQQSRSTKCRATPPDFWTQDQDGLLLHLRNTAQLTWENLLSYFPGMVLSAVKSRYQYLGKCGVDRPAINNKSKRLARSHNPPASISRKRAERCRTSFTKSLHGQRVIGAVAHKSVSRCRDTSKQLHRVENGPALKSPMQDESQRTSRSGRPIRHPFRNRPNEGYM